MKTITITQQAWATSADNFSRLMTEDLTEEEMTQLTSLYPSDMTLHGWISLGLVKATLELPPMHEAINLAAGAIHQEIGRVRAEASVTVMNLERKLSDLLMIGYTTKESQTIPEPFPDSPDFPDVDF